MVAARRSPSQATSKLTFRVPCDVVLLLGKVIRQPYRSGLSTKTKKGRGESHAVSNPHSFHPYVEVTHIIHITMNENSHRGPDETPSSQSPPTSLRRSHLDTIPELVLPRPDRFVRGHPGLGSYNPPPCSITIRSEEGGWPSDDERSSWDCEDDSVYFENELKDGIFQIREILEVEPKYSYGRCPRRRGYRRQEWHKGGQV